MTDPTIAALDLTVFGGPSSIDVDVDFGTQGERGSRIYGITADPRLSTTPKEFDSKVFDLVLVVTPSAPDYLTMYQKVGVAAEAWIPLAELFPNIFSTKQTKTFTSGSTTIDIVLNEVFTIEDQNYDVSKFAIQYSIEDRVNEAKRPVSSSISLAVNASGSDQVLTITIKAIEYNSTGGVGGVPVWQDVTGPRVIHLLATVV
jgi:hypothetical protein